MTDIEEKIKKVLELFGINPDNEANCSECKSLQHYYSNRDDPTPSRTYCQFGHLGNGWKTPNRHEGCIRRTHKLKRIMTQGESRLYRKKPVVVEALQFTKDNFDACCAFVGPHLTDGTSKDEMYVGIETMEGEIGAQVGDYIIEGIEKEHYPCNERIFNATYEKVEDDE